MNEKTKTYVPKSIVKEIQFRDGGSMLKLSFDVLMLIEFAKANKNERGYLNLCITKTREVGKFGQTHCCWLDTYKPDPNRQRTSSPQQPGPSGTNQPDMSGLGESNPPF